MAGSLQPARGEIVVIEQDGARVGVRVAGDLTGDPAIAPGIRQEQGGSELAASQVGKRKRQQDYLVGCK